MASPTQPAFRARWFPWALAGLVAVFGAIRFAGACNDLWLDEIWSLRLVQQLHSPVEIVTKLWHDNNHPLNSLWLYLLGPGRAEWAYRLLSWLMGTATVALAGLIGRRQFQQLHPDESSAHASAAGLIAATLIGSCYFLIHYSSEARGYGPAVGFSFLAAYALLHATGKPVNGWAAIYGVACGLGLLAHLVAFQVMLAGMAWSAVVLFKNWSTWRARILHLAGWHLGPCLFLGIYYLGFVRKIEIGGGPKLGLREVLETLATFSLGFFGRWGVTVALPLFLAVTFLGLILVGRRARALAAYYVVGIFLAPAVGLCSSRFVLLYPRYFIVSAALALLLGGYVLARLWILGRWSRGTCGLIITAFLLGNGVYLSMLLLYGRGQYQAALQYIADHTPAGLITVSSDSDFRNFGVMDYYRSAVGPAHQLQYYPSNQLPPEGIQWIFLHRLDASTPAPPATLHDAGGRNYQVVRVYLHAPLSGWEWYIYRNLDENVLPAVNH